MCDGVWVLFEGSELHSLWNDEETLLEFIRENKFDLDPEYHFNWIRIED